MADLITVSGAFVILVGPFFWMILSVMSGNKKDLRLIKSTLRVSHSRVNPHFSSLCLLPLRLLQR